MALLSFGLRIVFSAQDILKPRLFFGIGITGVHFSTHARPAGL